MRAGIVLDRSSAHAIHRPWKPLTEEELDKLNDLVRSEPAVADMRSRIVRAANGATDEGASGVRTVLESRALLFLKRSREDNPQLSYDLQEFLLPLRCHLREVRTTVREARPDAGDFHYFPAHAQLFETVNQRILELGARPNMEALARVIRVRVVRDPGAQHQGLLYPLLREVFQLGLSVKQALVGCAERNGGRGSGILLDLGPSRTHWNPEEIERKLRERLGASLQRQADVQVETSVLPADSPTPRDCKPAFATSARSYSIGMLDSPGSLWAVSTLIASYGGNLVYLRLPWKEQGSAEEVAIETTPSRDIELAFETPIGFRNHHTFEYQLKSLHVVQAIHPVPIEPGLGGAVH